MERNELLSQTEAAVLIGVSRQRVDRMLRDGVLAGREIQQRRYVLAWSALEARDRRAARAKTAQEVIAIVEARERELDARMELRRAMDVELEERFGVALDRGERS